MIDVEPLLAPTTTNPPAGADLEYDPAFLALETLARGGPERQFHEQAEPPPWSEVLDAAVSLLARSKDLRIAIVYTRAAAHREGLTGFHAGVRLLTGLFERYWDSLFPMLDADDANDPALRINALAPLADAYTPFAENETLLHDLRECEVCRVHGEPLTVRDILIAHGKLPAREGENAATLARVEGMLADALAAQPDLLAPGIDLPRALQTLADAMTRCMGAERAPLIDKLMNTARTLAAQCRAVTPAASGAMASGSAAREEADVAVRRVAARPGEITSREDAIAMLDAVCAFLERTEPAHPAPLLIKRARGLLGKDFLSVMQDLAPDSLTQIHLIAGIRER
jgi:type VI secretion system protein ImpA